METTKLERYKRILADGYMEAHPGTPRQVAKQRVEPAATIRLAMASITAEADKSMIAMRHFAREMGKVSEQIHKVFMKRRGCDGG